MARAQFLVLAQLAGNGRIIRRIGHHADALKIFRRRTHHGRPADVDILDELFGRRARLGRRGGKGIQVYDHQIDGHDAMVGGLLAVLGLAALEKNSTVHFGMQRLYAPSQHLGPSREVGDVAHGDAGVPQQLGRAARADNFDPQRSEFTRELDYAGLVINADKRPFDSHPASRIARSFGLQQARQCMRLREISEGDAVENSGRAMLRGDAGLQLDAAALNADGVFDFAAALIF